MSDISDSTSTSTIRRLYQIDDTIENLTQEVNTLNGFMHKTELELSLISVKMKREKLRALSAIAKSQVLTTKMEVMIAESDLIMDIERLKDFKRRKLNGNEDALQEVTPSQPQVTPPPTTTTVSVQTTESMSNKKKKSRRSSSRKSPHDISSDETVIIPTIQESMGSLGGPSQIYQTSFSPGLFTATPANKSDSEVSLSSSVKAEFNKPYTKTLTQETVKKSPAKKHKCEEKGKSKGKSKHATKQTQSPSGFPKTVAELRKSANTPPNHMDSSSRATSTPKDSKTGDKNSTACATVTYAPVRHNMGVRLTQPGTSTSPHPYLYVNPATQTNTLFHSEKAGTSQSYNFYGSNP